ncbi:glycosyltransferase [Bosea sp. 2RAB26]|uniref:glycosyltransferase n=1 Tax=Bosea sp. 2RAB26 TaxID=3237476 RepID=UPI003F8F9DC9
MRFSIVVPTLDRRDMLAEALDSVAAEGDRDLEVIVVDGGSTDGTREMLAARGDITVLDDRRRGLYDAINQGIETATGEAILLLGSDDLLPPGTIASLRRGFADWPDVDAVCGRAELFDNVGGAVQMICDPRDLGLDAHAALVGASIVNARAFRARVFARIGCFDTAYATIADRAFLARFVAAGLSTAIVNATVYRYRRHSGSLTFSAGAENGEALRAELLRLARDVAKWSHGGRELRAKALALEGRCLAHGIAVRCRKGDAVGALAMALKRDPATTVHPLSALARGGVDRFMTGDRR